MSELKLKSLRDLLGKNYFIPSYQRGYRWEKRQVVDLLDDLYSFIIKKNKGEGSFYCLQPIVLKKCDEETKKSFLPDFQENCYEVIDGQQRLTTIYLLFKYLINENNFSSKLSNYGGLYNIFYQTVHGSNECIERPEKEKRDTPNDYYITQAYKEIEKWFRGRGEVKGDLLEAFESFLLYDANKTIVKKTCGYAQIIWYEVDKDVDPIKTFTRLNIGKIPLRNAELIKALFLQNRNKSNSADIQQIYIAKEWDQIEASLQEKRFWAFLNKDLKEIPNHIDFIFNVIFAVEGKKEEQAIKDNIIKSGKLEGLGSTKKINKEAEKQAKQAFNDKYGVDEYASFRFFSTKFEDALKKNEDALMQCIKNEWETVLEYYATFLDWFNNPLWYHYIGFLIYCSDPKKETEQIIKIYNLYKNSTKKEFRQKLIDEIKERLDIRLKTEGDGRSELINSAGEPIVYSDQNRTLLRQILVLYNIEHMRRMAI